MTSGLQAEERRRTFHTLDALRGIAAIEVVTRHSDQLFGALKLPESYLAVDLFFVMSGVVIANAYENRLLDKAIGGGRFAVLRTIRLYPLYLLGVSLGLLQLVGRLAQAHRIDAHVIAGAVIAAIFMVPSGPFPPLSTPRWSLFFEMAVNFVYGFTVRLLTTPVLIGISALAGLGLIVTEIDFRTLDIGWQIDQRMLSGFCRVLYSFPVGILIWRMSDLKGRNAPIAALACLLVAGVALAITIPEAGRSAFELMAVLVGFPLTVRLAMTFDVGPSMQKVFSTLGITSYAVYILHQPASLLFEAVLKRLTHHSAEQLGLIGGLAFIPFLIAGCWALDRHYDVPTRAFLTRIFLGGRTG